MKMRQPPLAHQALMASQQKKSAKVTERLIMISHPSNVMLRVKLSRIQKRRQKNYSVGSTGRI